MFFQFKEKVFGAVYQNNLILLDLEKNSYSALEEKESSALISILNKEFSLENSSYTFKQFGCSVSSDNHLDTRDNREIFSLISFFLAENIIEPCEFNIRKNDVAIASEPIGLGQVEWLSKVRNISFKNVSVFSILESFFTLKKIHSILKHQQIVGLLSFLRTRAAKVNFQVPETEQMLMLAKSLEIASQYYPKHTNCLPYAGSLATLAYKRGWHCKFIIGVQSLPFYSHAWIESGGEVINDSPDLQKRLAPILILSPEK